MKTEIFCVVILLTSFDLTELTKIKVSIIAKHQKIVLQLQNLASERNIFLLQEKPSRLTEALEMVKCLHSQQYLTWVADVYH